MASRNGPFARILLIPFSLSATLGPVESGHDRDKRGTLNDDPLDAHHPPNSRIYVPGSLLFGIATVQTGAVQTAPRLVLELQDYLSMPITGDLDGQNTRGQLSRVNYLREEPGGRRFFVNDLNGPLYIVDKQTKAFTTYLDFNGADGRPGLFQRFSFKLNFATGLTNFLFDPTTRATAFSTRFTWRSRRSPRRPRREPAMLPGLICLGTPRRQRSRLRRSTDRSIVKSC